MTERKKVTIRTLFNKVEKGEPISWLTCYDYPTAYFPMITRQPIFRSKLGSI